MYVIYDHYDPPPPLRSIYTYRSYTCRSLSLSSVGEMNTPAICVKVRMMYGVIS